MKSTSSTDCREKNTALFSLFPLDVLRIFVNNKIRNPMELLGI